MWSRLQSRLPQNVINTLVGRAGAIINDQDQQVFVQSGKDFFIGESGQDNRDLLATILGVVGIQGDRIVAARQEYQKE